MKSCQKSWLPLVGYTLCVSVILMPRLRHSYEYYVTAYLLRYLLYGNVVSAAEIINKSDIYILTSINYNYIFTFFLKVCINYVCIYFSNSSLIFERIQYEYKVKSKQILNSISSKCSTSKHLKQIDVEFRKLLRHNESHIEKSCFSTISIVPIKWNSVSYSDRASRWDWRASLYLSPPRTFAPLLLL